MQPPILHPATIPAALHKHLDKRQSVGAAAFKWSTCRVVPSLEASAHIVVPMSHAPCPMYLCYISSHTYVALCSCHRKWSPLGIGQKPVRPARPMGGLFE
uniref:HDC11025 n=1 Tax=Drosophila melanogaster TaxID=7227 RepID=Q6IKY5_DROME|nr:TPA_inf: HDC11025 [Drosophila melanogaster]